jgi:putative Ca2+/H+ antiporter (TMEM165/GDT1 family)
MRELATIFLSVFLAELGDKTQLATLLFAGSSKTAPWLIFIAAASALVVSTALAVLLGSAAQQYIHAIPTKLIAGLGFVAIGGWLVFEHFAH